MKELKGTIKNCIVSSATSRVVCNLIQGKTAKAIVTSRVVSVYTRAGSLFIETLNSIYKVEGRLVIS